MRLGLKFEVAVTRFSEAVGFADQKLACLRRVGLTGSDETLEAQTGFFLARKRTGSFEALCALVSGNQILQLQLLLHTETDQLIARLLHLQIADGGGQLRQKVRKRTAIFSGVFNDFGFQAHAALEGGESLIPTGLGRFQALIIGES